jgi:hypothetical protein
MHLIPARQLAHSEHQLKPREMELNHISYARKLTTLGLDEKERTWWLLQVAGPAGKNWHIQGI